VHNYVPVQHEPVVKKGTKAAPKKEQAPKEETKVVDIKNEPKQNAKAAKENVKSKVKEVVQETKKEVKKEVQELKKETQNVKSAVKDSASDIGFETTKQGR